MGKGRVSVTVGMSVTVGRTVGVGRPLELDGTVPVPLRRRREPLSRGIVRVRVCVRVCVCVCEGGLPGPHRTVPHRDRLSHPIQIAEKQGDVEPVVGQHERHAALPLPHSLQQEAQPRAQAAEVVRGVREPVVGPGVTRARARSCQGRS